MNRVLDKVCIVTGSAQGIGRAIVETYAAEGAKMIIAVDMQEASYNESNIRAVTLDTTDKEGVISLIKSVWDEFGRLDVIVNNAGITRDALCNKMTDDNWDLVMDVNLKAPHYIIAAATPYLMEQGSGSIINLSSVSGVYGNIGQLNYAASKAGLIGMTKTWTKELSRKGAKIRCNCIAPGYVETPMIKTVPEEIIEKIKNKILFKELVQPIDVAYAALYLASEESRFITGQTLEISGGWLM
ncbi:MAG: SDR family oxidoreductase [Oscillospiraceae bacterium]|jgi:3-oxoacyl-[acyl-carrier protein] reductase|nr:SDR family oxidoreductase [Oscillospiraceae bacterium]